MTQLFELLGGLGVFLLGVVIMTDGLKGVAGNALRMALARFTHTPVAGACTGAISTAILQSSSAVTVAAVGFVGAGLLSFQQSIGIIFGANVGTTVTGWLVALLGFKLQLGILILPIILFGVLMHLFGKGRWISGGMGLAGFGLIFVGIAAMQSGMSGLEGQITPDNFPPNTLGGRLLLILIGIAITLVTQSSSAGVAAALTAVHTGTINFEQAAAMVIGMNLGTTVTALVATLGGSTETRRTGYAHVMFNVLVSVGAYLLLRPYVLMIEWYAPGYLEQQAEISLVAFHTSFNLLGAIALLPFTSAFADLVIRLVPEKSVALTRHLDTHLLKDPIIALEAVRSTLVDIHLGQLEYMSALINHSHAANPEKQLELEISLDTTLKYLDLIHSSTERENEWEFLMNCIHGLDHMQRLQYRLTQQSRAQSWRKWPVLRPTGDEVLEAFNKTRKLIENNQWPEAAETASAISALNPETAEKARDQIISRIASGVEKPETGDEQLRSARWLQRVAEHEWRITHHLNLADKLSHSPSQSAADLPEASTTSP